MGVFSTNQNRQMYVALTAADSVSAASTAGSIAVKSNTANTEMYFNYVGADGTVMRSDIIPVDKILYAKTTAADDLKLKLKSVQVSLADTLKAGEDYILRINIAQAFGKGDDTTYQKFGAVRATSSMTATQFWTAMKASLERNFSKELTKWFEFSLVKEVALTTNTGVSAHLTSATSTTTKIQFAVAAESEGVSKSGDTYTVSMTSSKKTLADAKRILGASDYSNTLVLAGDDSITMKAEASAATLSGDANGLTITEVEQPWVPGKTPKENVHFSVVNCYVKDSAGVEVEAFTIEKPVYFKETYNGHIVVDQEIFYIGERGDQYRDTCGIYKIDTKYLANATTNYCAIDLHYSFVDANEGAQKSEKDIYIVGEKSQINTLVSAINSVKANLLSAIA